MRRQVAFHRRICETFDVLYEEGETAPRVMGIALHPFLIGVPHRIRYLDRALRYIASHQKVWFATGHEIIEAYRRSLSQANEELRKAAAPMKRAGPRRQSKAGNSTASIKRRSAA